MIRILTLMAVILATAPAGAVEPDEILPDPAMETRAREISKDLRCLVCQNQSIDDSNAELAHDLRVLVRDRLMAGDSNQAVIDYVVSRYGDFVLLKPPFKASTMALWAGPGLIFLAGGLALVFYFRRRRTASAAPLPLTDEEKRRLALLVRDEPE